MAVVGLVLALSAGGAARLLGAPGGTPSDPAAETTLPAAPALLVAVDEPAFQAVSPAPVPPAAAAPGEGEAQPPVAADDTAGTATEPAPPVRTHRVAPGDSLALIAARYGLRVETLLWANELEDPSLVRPGDELRVPAMDGVVYTLQPGDTLVAVAERAGVPLAEILAANRLQDPDRVAAGTQVLVPGAAAAAFADAPTGGVQTAAAVGAGAPAVPPKPAPVTYEVQPGDTLATLGSKFGVDLDTLLAANDITDPNTIRVGTTLRVLPVSGVEHVVQPGERLADIAARYKTVLGLILDFNDLTDPDLLRAGDRLVIPGGRRPAAGAAGAPAEVLAKPAPAPAAQPEVAKPAPPPKPAAPAPVPAPPAAQPAPPVAPAPSGGALGQRIVAEALKYNGYRYTWGGTSPSTGFDCSGLVWYVHQQVGAPISRGLWGQYNAGRQVSRAELQPGDIVFFQNTYMPGLSHNGVYIGNGQFINAVDESTGVVISRLDNPYWASRWFGATRVGG